MPCSFFSRTCDLVNRYTCATLKKIYNTNKKFGEEKKRSMEEQGREIIMHLREASVPYIFLHFLKIKNLLMTCYESKTIVSTDSGNKVGNAQ